jgi:hypothetical protein
MKLTSADRLHLFKVGAQAFGYIVIVIGVVAFILAVYHMGAKNERRRTEKMLQAKDQRIKILERDSVYMRELIFQD